MQLSSFLQINTFTNQGEKVSLAVVTSCNASLAGEAAETGSGREESQGGASGGGEGPGGPGGPGRGQGSISQGLPEKKKQTANYLPAAL